MPSYDSIAYAGVLAIEHVDLSVDDGGLVGDRSLDKSSTISCGIVISMLRREYDSAEIFERRELNR